MHKLLVTTLLLATAVAVRGQQCLISEGEVFAHGVSRTGMVPAALQQLLGARRWHVQDEARLSTRRLLSRARRGGHMAPEQTAIGPLFRSVRDQEEPFNLLCPRWTYSDGSISEDRCLSGCVATAIEQVMAYYRYPEQLKDTLFGWQTENYVIEDMLPGTRFDWNNYLPDYRNGWTGEQGLATALVSLAAGMAVHMNYGLKASSASTYRAVEPLHRAFGYGMAEYFERVLYTPSRWHAMLRHELEEGRPIVYAGHNMDLSGHAFNIDGIDADGYYHVNWGYNGSYDGWYDLDWLNPFEGPDFTTDGYVAGFFCNQSALFMHPSEQAQPLQPDTLALDDLGVELESLTMSRTPDIQGRIAADFLFSNHGADSVTYTYEVMTWLPTDTAIFRQADYVGLAALTLAPGERKVQRTYLNFSEAGQRIIGISHDDVTIPFQQPITIEEGIPGDVEWGSIRVDVSGDGRSATVDIPVTNHAAGGFASDLYTLCLFADGHENEDTRHFGVLSLPAGETIRVSETFRQLEPGHHYTLLLRCPWTIQQQADFTTPIPAGLSGRQANVSTPAPATMTFDLSGRRVSAARAPLLIRQGKKYVRRSVNR